MVFSGLGEGLESRFVYSNKLDLKLHYLVAESFPEAAVSSEEVASEAVLMLHGWPSSSYLYRHILPELAQGFADRSGRAMPVIALDLPGYGGSSKPRDASYSFPFYAESINEFLDALGIECVHLVVHDLGGPVGLWWAAQHSERVMSYVLLDTIIDANFSWAVKVFVGMTLFPGVKQWLSSPAGLKFAMRFGLSRQELMDGEVLQNYQRPFADKVDRKGLLKSASSLHMKGFELIESHLASLDKPLCLIAAGNDKVLPEVVERFTGLKTLQPEAPLHIIPDCGHFFQEEKPEEISEHMLSFYRSYQFV